MHLLGNNSIALRVRFAIAIIIITTTAMLPLSPVSFAIAQEATENTTTTSSTTSDTTETESSTQTQEHGEGETQSESETETAQSEMTQTEQTQQSNSNEQQTSAQESSTAETTEETTTTTTTTENAVESNENDTNISDTNATNTSSESNGSSSEEDNAGDAAAAEQQEEDDASPSTSTESNSENDATPSDDTTIATGDAAAGTNLANVVNTTLIDSQGLMILLNLLFGDGASDLDLTDELLNLFDSTSGSTPTCTLESCLGMGVDLNVQASSTADITNDVVVRSSTGENTATSTDGAASITTGDASAAANIVNVANSNIIRSNYVLVSINSLGDLLGDIILPGKAFFDSFLKNNGGSVGALSAENSNNAAITNNVDVDAESGNNTATSTDGDTAIETGDSAAAANVTNNVNQNFFGGDSLVLMFRVHGAWNGEIRGLPDGVTWTETPFGIQIMSDDGSEALAAGGTTTINTTNTANITNNVQVLALTGENKVAASDGARITTGDAFAGANIFNIANTNIVGRNWIFAMFNIFGDWDGNVAFGQPNLWIGARVSSGESTVEPGAELTYHFTVSNRGSADATSISLELDFLEEHLSFNGPDTRSWNIGSIPAGETIELAYNARVSSELGRGDTALPLTASVWAQETDADPNDNTEEIIVVARNGTNAGRSITYTPNSDLQLTKTASVDTVEAPGSVAYELNIVNEGDGPAYYAELFDTVRNGAGDVIEQETWWLGEIPAGEEIQITYTVEFATSTPPGVYSNTAQVKAIDRHPSVDPFYGRLAHSNEVVASVEVRAAEPREQVLGVSVSRACEPYLTDYISTDRTNHPSAVQKLQAFLRDYENFDIEVNGRYDTATYNAVRGFQERYRADILDPWGISAPTGFVYYTTRQKLNERYCELTGETFPLTSEQEREINQFRTQVEQRVQQGAPLLNTDTVGSNIQPVRAAERPTLDPVVLEKEQGEQVAAAHVAVDVGDTTRTDVTRSFFGSVLNALKNLFSFSTLDISLR